MFVGIGIGIPHTPAAGVGYEPEATALFARFTTPPDAARKGLINTLIKALKTAGIWSKLDAFYVMAAADSQAGRQNWVADQYNLTAVSGPVFTADRGYQGDGASSYLDTGFNPTTAASPKFNQNSGHTSFWSRTAGQGAGVDMGNGNSIILTRQATNDNYARRVNTAASEIGANSDGTGDYLVSRTGATTMASYKDGAAFGGVSSAAAISPDNASIRILGRGTSVSYSARQGASGSIGGGLTAGEALALRNARLAYLQAVGAA